jgi:hypothetical protein
MLFEIDADLLYIRPCLAKIGFKKRAVSQHLLLSSAKPLKMHVDGSVISAFISQAKTINDLFDLEGLGQSVSQNYDLMDEEGIDLNYWDSYVQSEFSGLSWEDFHRHESVWDEDMVKLSYQENYLDEYAAGQIDGVKATYEQYKKSFIEGKLEIVKQWLVSNEPGINDNKLIHAGDFGGWASGAWYPSDYNLAGMTKIKSIKVIIGKSKKARTIGLDELKTLAFSEATEMSGLTDKETLIDIEDILNKTNQNYISSSSIYAQNLLDNNQRSKRNFYLAFFILTSFIVWYFII